MTRTCLELGRNDTGALFPVHILSPCPQMTCISCYQIHLGSFYKSQREEGEGAPGAPSYPPYLDDTIHIALVLIAGDGSVGPDDKTAVDAGREVDMFAWGPRAQIQKGCCGLAAFLLPFKILWDVLRGQKCLASCWRPKKLLGGEDCPTDAPAGALPPKLPSAGTCANDCQSLRSD